MTLDWYWRRVQLLQARKSADLRCDVIFPRLDTGVCRRRFSKVASAKQQEERQTSPVRLSFSLPYRCNFGQNLSIVGSLEALGKWDVQHSINMEWTKGDVWKVDLELPASSNTELQYKYIVRNTDGEVATWKPGSNYQFQFPRSTLNKLSSSLLEEIKILDAWDSSCQEVEVELRQNFTSESTASDTQVKLGAHLTQQAEEALDELKHTVEQSSAILDACDPVSAEALEADKRVAAAAIKASNLTKALNEYKAKGELEMSNE